MTTDRSLRVRYAVAIAAVVVAAGVRLSLDPLWGTSLPLITFFPAIMASAWFGGFGPGIATTVLAAVAANYFWMEPRNAVYVGDVRDAVALAVLVLVGIFMSGVTEGLQRSRRRQADALNQERAAVAATTASEERLRVTIASIGDAVITTDDEGRIVVLNPVAEALTGWTAAEATGRPLDDVFVIVNELTRQPAENPVERVLREGIIAGLTNHTVLVSRDGREIPVDDSAAPLKAADGRVVGAVMVFRDVSERRHVERERAALLDRERRARAAAERANGQLRNVLDVTDTALANLGLDDLVRQLLARARSALGGDTATMLLLEPGGGYLTPVTSEGLREAIGADIRIPLGRGIAGRIAVSEQGVVFDDLAALDVVSPVLREKVKSLVGAPLRIGDRLVGVIHVGAVVPQRFTSDDLQLLRLVAERASLAIERARLYEAEHAARAAAETAARRLSFLAEASQLLSSTLDYQTRLASVARLAVPRLADFCAVDVVGSDGTVRRLAVTHVDPAKEQLARELRERYPFDADAPTGVPRVLRTGQSEFFPEISASLLESRAKDAEQARLFRGIGVRSAIIAPLVARERVLGAITLVYGESGRRYDAADLALAEDLGRRTGLAADNARLYQESEELLVREQQARREADAANRMKDEFLAMLSHELRTPLTSIVGWARMLRATGLDDATRLRAVEVIERSAKVQATLVDDLLDISRFMRGDVRLDLRPLDLPPVMEAAVDAVRASAEAKALTLDRTLDVSAGPVDGDADRLQQIVGNLLTNAIKFTPAGGRVSLSLERSDGRARITVSDTGNGISANFLPYVFESFRQGEGAREHGGLGIGLAIVQRLVELHGGTVRAESDGEGQGARFTVLLPLVDRAPA